MKAGLCDHHAVHVCVSPYQLLNARTNPYEPWYIQGVKKYMLERSVVDRWVQSDHILLTHPCPETLPFATKGHRSLLT
jgi:hypothetical protein